MATRQSGPRRRPAPPHIQEKAKQARSREAARAPRAQRRFGRKRG